MAASVASGTSVASAAAGAAAAANQMQVVCVINLSGATKDKNAAVQQELHAHDQAYSDVKKVAAWYVYHRDLLKMLKSCNTYIYREVQRMYREVSGRQYVLFTLYYIKMKFLIYLLRDGRFFNLTTWQRASGP